MSAEILRAICGPERRYEPSLASSTISPASTRARRTPQVNTHPPTDRPHRDTRSGEAYSLRLLVEAEPRSTARHVAAAEVGEHRGAVDAIPFGQRLDTHPGQVVTDELVHLGGGEKSLSRLDSPHNRVTIVLRSGILGTSRDLVDPTV